MTADSRMNVAGILPGNAQHVADSVAAILRRGI
jgi:hypothetical protein